MALERFHFEASTGEKFEVPFMQDALSMKKVKALRKAHKDDAEALGEAFIAAALGKQTADKIDDLSIRDYTEFTKGWMGQDDDEGVASLGE